MCLDVLISLQSATRGGVHRRYAPCVAHDLGSVALNEAIGFAPNSRRSVPPSSGRTRARSIRPSFC